MWPSQRTKYLQPAAYSKRTSSYVDRHFQLKYIRYIMITAVVSSVFMLLPAAYFVNQNYELFHRWADSMSPSLVRYISKEMVAINIIFTTTFVGNLMFWIIIAKKMTAKIAGPAKVIRNHIRLVGRGDYSLPPLKLREDDEFKELVNTYNYLYGLLRVQNERELEQLKSVLPAITNPIANRLISQFITDRTTRLNGGTVAEVASIARDEAPDSAHDSRRAS